LVSFPGKDNEPPLNVRSENMKNEKYWTPGNVVEIPMTGGKWCYGVVLSSPLIGFLNVRSDSRLTVEKVSDCTILFRIWVMKYAIGKNGWQIIGQLSLTDDMKQEPWFFKKDAITGKLTKYRHPEEVPASPEECRRLECAAVWDPSHVESRLNDHFDGRPNKWVESLSLK